MNDVSYDTVLCTIANPASFVAGSVASSCTLRITTLSGSITETASATLHVTRQVRYCINRLATVRVPLATDNSSERQRNNNKLKLIL